MKTIHVRILMGSLMILTIAFLASPLGLSALATQAGYTLDWWTVDGGGATADTNSGYTLGGAIGQPDAAVWRGGDYTLTGGFWGSGGTIERTIYLPLVIKTA
ncbi:MAG: hypothetical protein GVY30_03340 [Chloroflexi bacterium]|nr:hypothetical protein [Chloroflexota bacterium]